MNKRIDISHKTVFFITGFLALLWALYQIREVIILLFIAIIFMSAFAPLVEKLEKMKVPKALAVAAIYVLVIALIAGLISLVIRPLVEQTNSLITALPKTVERTLPPGVDRAVIQQELTNFSRGAFSVTLTIFNEVVALISIAVLTFYLLLERDKLDDLVAQFFIGREDKVKRAVRRIEEKLGAWLRGQVALSLIIGVTAYVALSILNVPYALPLAIVAGILEVIPVIGPIISALPAVLIAYMTSPVLALMVVVAFFVIQQLENHVVVPQVMKKAVGLNPLIVILAVAIGGKLLGIAGALLAVPIAVVLQIILEEGIHEEKVGA